MRHHTGQVIDNGRVMCLRDGQDVDIERCLECPNFSGIETPNSRLAEVRCDHWSWTSIPARYSDAMIPAHSRAKGSW